MAGITEQPAVKETAVHHIHNTKILRKDLYKVGCKWTYHVRTMRRTDRGGRERGGGERERERESSAVICYFKDTQLETGHWAPVSNGVGIETKLHFGLRKAYFGPS